MKKDVKKVVLAYSGGLDTSIILKWLQDEYKCEVVTFTADIGQGEELEPARQKALELGIKPENIFIEDLKEEFARDFVFPMFRANAVYEGEYLLGTSIARPLIAKKQAEIAAKVGADGVSHGATGKGNDQVRFELGYYALGDNLTIIAPWREWDLNSREKLLKYAEKNGIKIEKKPGKSPYSMDANLLHISYEGLVLENPAHAPEADMWRWTVSPKDAPNESEIIEIGYEKGDPVSINGKKMSPAALLAELNRLGAKHGIGRLDLVENRCVGMKSRGVYETPGGTILYYAHEQLEHLCLDRDTYHYKQQIALKQAELIYNGLWFTSLMSGIMAFNDKVEETVSGWVRLKLYKGTMQGAGSFSPYSLYNESIASFTTGDLYDHRDAGGFITLFGLPLTVRAMMEQKAGKGQAVVKSRSLKKRPTE